MSDGPKIWKEFDSELARKYCAEDGVGDEKQHYKLGIWRPSRVEQILELHGDLPVRESGRKEQARRGVRLGFV